MDEESKGFQHYCKCQEKTELFGTDVKPIAFQLFIAVYVHNNSNAKQRF